MTDYNSSNTNALIKASSDTVRVASEVVDFSSTTNAATDTFDIIGIPDITIDSVIQDLKKYGTEHQ